jgi:2-polyprenyl-3-methyl-5-hydroxy-6-metoxy-1,4-benzoquinol methylase
MAAESKDDPSVRDRNRVFWENRLHRFPDYRGVGHWRFSSAYNASAYEVKLATLGALLRKYRIEVETKSVLDVGCGIGIYASFFRSLGAHVTGIDIVDIPSIAPRADFLDGIHFVQADVSRTDLNLGKKFDIVCMFEVGLHITHRRDFHNTIRNISRHLRQGGWLLILDCFTALGRRPAPHVRLRTRKEWYAALRDQGIEVVASEPIIYLLYRTPLAFVPGGIDFVLERALQRLRPSSIFGSLQLLIGRRATTKDDLSSRS